MENIPFINYTGIAVPMMQDNIDTDQIIPSKEMKSVSKTGLAVGLFARQRYLEGRAPDPKFVLNQPKYAEATILLSGKNFGCGSSREHAVWALKEYGFKVIVAESFGEIFYNNCVRNGILPIVLNSEIIRTLNRECTIYLSDQTIDGERFEISDGDKHSLFEGLDMIAQTLEHQSEISVFIKQDKIMRPWIYE